jgi:hypothetical protein
MKECIQTLDKYRYACFSNPSHSLNPVKQPPVPRTKQKGLSEVFIVHRKGGQLVAQSIAEMVSFRSAVTGELLMLNRVRVIGDGMRTICWKLLTVLVWTSRKKYFSRSVDPGFVVACYAIYVSLFRQHAQKRRVEWHITMTELQSPQVPFTSQVCTHV